MLYINTVNNFNILLVGIFVFYTVYAFIYWMKSNKSLNKVYLFDIIFVQIALSLIFFYTKKIHISDGFLSCIFDGRYSLCSILLGILLSTFIFSKKQNFSLFKFVERSFLSYCFASILFLFILLFSDIFLGIEVKDGIAIVINGVSRMPVIIILLICIILLLFLYYSLNKFISREILLGFLIMIYAMCAFALEFFIVGYNPSIANLINLNQIISIVIFIFGISIILTRFKRNKRKRINRVVLN